MTQEDKQLLLKDLSARFTYGTIVSVTDGTIKYNAYIESISYKYIQVSPVDADSNFTAYTFYKISEIKSYLRPMSSMSEDEAKELLFVRLVSKYGESCAYIKNFIKLNEVSFRKEPPYKGSIAIWFSFENKIHDTPQIREYSKCEYLGQINDITLVEIDWLNAHHFDYRDLIPKGLALEAPDGMYN